VQLQLSVPVITIGWLVALIVLLVVIVLAILSQLPLLLAGLIGGVALSRLL
jgi:hypothetical protein